MAESAKRNYKRKESEYVPIGPNEFGKLPPQAPELEEAVLGAIMVERDAYATVAGFLREQHFYKEIHQYIYHAITTLSSKQEPVDMHTVTEQLRKDGKIEQVGGPYYIALLTSKVSSAAHLEFHARIIVQKYLARELIRISSEIQTKAFDDRTDIDDLMQEAEGMMFQVSQQSMQRTVVQIDPVISEAIDRIRQAQKSDGTSGVPSGFHDLDKLTSGWQASDLIIIAARPAMGKTADVLSMMRNMAVDYKQPVALFSLEMSNVQLVNRLLMNVCEIEGEKIKNGQLSYHEWAQLDAKVQELYGAPIYVDDTPSLSIFELRSKARRLAREKGIKCIIIDYLQLMNASGMNFGSREQEVSMISRSLKGLAKELNIPIIALSQLNRSVENRGGSTTGQDTKRPQLSDLRESGAIEQDADMVCFIHRPEYYRITEGPNGEDLRGKAYIIVAKHRNGATDDVLLRFKNIYAKFMNIEDGDENPYATFRSKLNNNTSGMKGNTGGINQMPEMPDYGIGNDNPPF